MKSVKNDADNQPKRKRKPARSPEARLNQCIALAYDLAEQQLLDGTASSQVITHFLRLGTETAEIEKENLRKQGKLLDAKAGAYESAEEMKALYKDAMTAFARYSGNVGAIEDEEDPDV